MCYNIYQGSNEPKLIGQAVMLVCEDGNNMKKIVTVLLALTIAVTAFSGCDKKRVYKLDDGSVVSLKGGRVKEKVKKEDGRMVSYSSDDVKVKVEMEDGGVFVMELYPQYAPETVENFLNLADDGFYDGLTFHRIIPGFMTQGGDPEGTGMGGSGTNIHGEFKNNGFSLNTLKHERGTVSMARAMDPDSASSQFFICFEPANYLDGDYAAFGKVVYGMDEVDTMAEVATDANDKPLTPVVMKKMTIITDDEYKNMSK